MGGSLLNERFIAANPSLIATVGSDQAIILQEIWYSSSDPRIGDTEGGVQLSHAEIAELTGIKKDTVFRCCKKLEDAGLVNAHKESRTSPKTYTVNVEAVEEACAPARQQRLAQIRGRAQRSTTANSRKHYRESAVVDHIYIKEEEEEPEGSGSNPLTDPEYEPFRNGANYVLRRWAEVNNAKRQKLTRKAVEDMRLLMQRGPVNWDKPEEVTGDEIRAVLEAALADGFWSEVIQSPGNLRKHWDKLVILSRPKAKRSTSISPDEAVTVLLDTYNSVGHQGWRHMLEALADRPDLKAIAAAIGPRSFQGSRRDLEFAIRNQARKEAA